MKCVTVDSTVTWECLFCCVLITVLPKNRKWSGRLDSRGFRILTDQVINVQQLTQEQVLLILKDSIIHEDGTNAVLHFSIVAFF